MSGARTFVPLEGGPRLSHWPGRDRSDGLRRLEQVYLRAITALRKARREIEGAVELQHRVRDELINMLNPAQLTEVRSRRGMRGAPSGVTLKPARRR